MIKIKGINQLYNVFYIAIKDLHLWWIKKKKNVCKFEFAFVMSSGYTYLWMQINLYKNIFFVKPGFLNNLHNKKIFKSPISKTILTNGLSVCLSVCVKMSQKPLLEMKTQLKKEFSKLNTIKWTTNMVMWSCMWLFYTYLFSLFHIIRFKKYKLDM